LLGHYTAYGIKLCNPSRAGNMATGKEQARHFAKPLHDGMRLAPVLAALPASTHQPETRANACASGADRFAMVFVLAVGRVGTA